ncbi:TlpA family protein disulfide reductase [Marinicauda salina]|uniref:TlpA family protein disulfide reductase n=1 Tax=Marinicauda salina TaxID=2135793 RepID=A0A2U2BQR8_9PROT|nr:TlpA family protein disulfide reductase [Marinicauda salina]PWE16353.1 TlpA family protein disulfide reductase [Marinicauda salina]
MKPSPLKIGLITLPILGGLAILYVIFSALGDSTPDALDRFAVGEMRGFRSVEDAPPQPQNPILTGGGREITLADKRGKVILVNFWATWCAPCVVEMPALDALQAELGSADFEVVPVSMDRSIEDARAFYAENELVHLELYHDQSFRAAMDVGARGLPVSILYDRNGAEIGRMSGEADWASEDAFALIEAAVERY